MKRKITVYTIAPWVKKAFAIVQKLLAVAMTCTIICCIGAGGDGKYYLGEPMKMLLFLGITLLLIFVYLLLEVAKDFRCSRTQYLRQNVKTRKHSEPMLIRVFLRIERQDIIAAA